MIRKLELICLLIALNLSVGIYSFHVWQRVIDLDKKIEVATEQLAEIRDEKTPALKFEWAVLNDPERLAKLAASLPLVTLKPSQFYSIGNFGSYFPAPTLGSEKPN